MDPASSPLAGRITRADAGVRAGRTIEARVAACFQQYREPVYRYLVAAFGQPAQAEDVTQEAFLQLYRHLHAGNPVDNARAWVFRVAHNLAINRIKSDQFLAPFDDAAFQEVRRTLQDSVPSPEQKLLQRERFERLRAALTRLTSPERQCLHLRARGLRYREIADILGIGTTTVAETLYRVIEKLAKENQ